MPSVDYTGVAERIQAVYHSCSKQEQAQLLKILQEMSITGESETLERIWLADFKEVPVSIDQFICDPYYLGETNRNGDAVYPFWKETLRDIFNHGNQYNEIILSGATRIGKTSTAISIGAYMLYRLMLYKNPHEYFKKKQVSKFTIAFANLTDSLARGIAYREYNDTLRNSGWFCDRGRFSRSERNFYYIPEGDKIDIVAASDATQLLGMQTWFCLVGNTKILTSDGCCTLEEACNSYQEIVQLDNHGKLINCIAPVVLTKYVSDTIKITLEDGSAIEGTPEHPMLLTNGSYKALGELTKDDNILVFNIGEVDQGSIEKADIHEISKIEKIHYENPIPVYDVINAGDHHNFAVMAGQSIMIAHNCVMDETNFAKTGVKDINIAKNHMKKLYDTVNARISGTFRIRGEVYGKLVASSSKNSDSDFLSTHIETQLNAGNQHMYLVDKPQWEILPKSMFSEDVFHFTVGDRYKKGFVIPEENDDEAHRAEYLRQGFQVIEAPAELRKNFVADYDISLRDIAGISVVGTSGFITQEAITPNLSATRHNAFFTDVIHVGTQDNVTIEQFFHQEVVPERLKHCPLFIHLDLSETGDRTGIGGVCVDGLKTVTTFDGKQVSMPFMRELFNVGVEAPRGDRISFQKIVNFLIWLRRNHFNIFTVTTDQYQSSYLREVISAQGIKTAKISVDSSDEPYIGLKNILYDQRIELIHNELRDDELIHLTYVNRRVDHPPTKPDGGAGSKDLADALCGCCYQITIEQVRSAPPPGNVAKAIAAVNGGSRSKLPSMFNSPYTKFPR